MKLRQLCRRRYNECVDTSVMVTIYKKGRYVRFKKGTLKHLLASQLSSLTGSYLCKIHNMNKSVNA
jgi:hypothetical protein